MSAPGVTGLDGDWSNPSTATPHGDTYPSGDYAAGGDFVFQSCVLSADSNGDQVVNALDVADVKKRLLRRPGDGVTRSNAYSIFADVNADGVINSLDISAVKARLGQAVNEGGLTDLDVDSDNNNGKGTPDVSTDEETKEDTAPGKVIAVNNDDDNANGVPDNQEAALVAGEDDLWPMLLAVGCSCSCTGTTTAVFSMTSGASFVRVWDISPDPNRLLLGVGAGATVTLDTIPDQVWVEAVAPSASSGDIRFTLTARGLQDAVQMTAVGTRFARVNPDSTFTPVEDVDLSHPTPKFSNVSISIVPGSLTTSADKTKILGDVAISGQLDDAASDLIEGSAGTIASVAVYQNGTETPLTTISTNVSKQVGASILKPFDFSASFSTTL